MVALQKSLSDINRAKILSQRRIKLRITEYKLVAKSISGKMAEFLDWVGTKYPRHFVTYEEIAQAVFSLGKLPVAASKQVESVRGAMSAARRVMHARYKRDVITVKGVGARATVDAADTLTTSVMRDVTSHERRCKRLQDTVALVNQKELDDLIEQAPPDLREDLKVSRNWFVEHLTKYVKTLQKSTTTVALLPPAPGMPE